MAASPKFATGRYAWGMCDICGIRCKLLELRGTTQIGRPTGLLACPTCWDVDHPQNFLPQYVANDPQALRSPRPDTGLAASRVLLPPGNWFDGHRPSLALQEAEQLAIQAEQAKQRALDRMQEEEQKTRQRSF